MQIQQTLTESLKENAQIFARIGRRFIINLNYVFHIDCLKGHLTLSDGETFAYQLPVSKDALTKTLTSRANKQLKQLYVNGH